MSQQTEKLLDTIEVTLPSIEEITLIDGMVVESVLPDQPATNIEVEWLEAEQVSA